MLSFLIRGLRTVQAVADFCAERPMGLIWLSAAAVLAWVWGFSEAGSLAAGVVFAALGGPLAALVAAFVIGAAGLVAEVLADLLECRAHSSL